MVNIPLSLFSINDEVKSEYCFQRYANDVCAATQRDRNNIYSAGIILSLIITWDDDVGAILYTPCAVIFCAY